MVHKEQLGFLNITLTKKVKLDVAQSTQHRIRLNRPDILSPSRIFLNIGSGTDMDIGSDLPSCLMVR